jgi:hypothetical protein
MNTISSHPGQPFGFTSAAPTTNTKVVDAWICWECDYESDTPSDRDRHRRDSGHTAIGALHYAAA